jgi:hypothetical protein
MVLGRPRKLLVLVTLCVSCCGSGAFGSQEGTKIRLKEQKSGIAPAAVPAGGLLTVAKKLEASNVRIAVVMTGRYPCHIVLEHCAFY